MKLTWAFILILNLQMSGSVWSQTTTMSVRLKNATLQELLTKIEKGSEYRFFYNNDEVDVNQRISVDAEEKTIGIILETALKGLPYSFKESENKLIVIERTNEVNNALLPNAQQGKKVTGKVTDQTGASLPGVSVVVKGTTIGVITDTNGMFYLSNFPENSTLQFSFVGMKTQEIAVGGKSAINVVMEDEIVGIEDVIVIGYGTAKRQDYTGSVSSLKMENSPVSLAPNLNALESLKGNVAGLSIGATNTAGGQPSMDIRGQNSISGSNDPLIVLDGVIFLGSISDINPNDIASYDILKDAVSSAAYGSRSANGVIAITTKNGKTGKPIITLNTSGGIQTWQNQPVMMKGEEWLNLANARSRYAVGTTTWLLGAEKPNQAAGNEIVWLDKVIRTGVIQDYQISVSGAGQNVNYYLSTSYNQNKGIVVGDDFNHISLLAKVNTTITSWLKVGIDGNYSRRDYSGNAANVEFAEILGPYGAVYRDDNGNYEKYPYTQSVPNPLWGVNDNTCSNKDVRNNFRLNAYSVIDVPWVKGLNFKINALINLDQNQAGNFYNENYFIKEGYGLARYEPATVVGFLASANGNIDNNKAYSYVFDNILNYKNTFNKHSIEATLVATRDYRRYEQVNSTGSDFASNGNTALDMWGLHKATVQKVNLNIDERANIGYLGRLSYSYNDKYFFTSSYRRDGASVFGSNKKWGNFAAFGTAWKISNEDFLKSLKPLDNLKIKLSWGQNGNQGIGPYATLSTIANGSSSNYRYEFSNAPGKISYGLIQNTLGNSDLGWETTETWNTGFESSWLNYRLYFDADLYFSKTTDQIFIRNIPVMTGFKTILASMGQVNNTGVELTLRSVNVKTRDLNWTSSVTYWKNNNKLVHLYGEDKNNDGKEDDDISGSLFIGKSLGAVYGYEQDGIVQADDTQYTALTGTLPGAPKYKDIDGVAGITGADRKILGYTKENFRLNMSNSVTYKNFELYAMITGTFGGNNYFLRSNTSAFLSGDERFCDNTISKPYWTTENKTNVYPSPYFVGDGRYQALQSRGFVRIQDVSLSYTFNQRWIKAANISSLKVFLSAKNLATFTNWIGGDPETGATVAQNIYPVPSTLSFGANISF